MRYVHSIEASGLEWATIEGLMQALTTGTPR
jgi:hypothetical protein